MPQAAFSVSTASQNSGVMVNAGYVAEEIETKIVAARSAEKLRLQQRAELIRKLLITPAQHSREIGFRPPA